MLRDENRVQYYKDTRNDWGQSDNNLNWPNTLGRGGLFLMIKNGLHTFDASDKLVCFLEIVLVS